MTNHHPTTGTGDSATSPSIGTQNTAESGATIGMQAGYVQNSTVHQNSTVQHNSTVHFHQPGDPPEKKYRDGVSCLGSGRPDRARVLIGEAIDQGYNNSEARFHRMLAVLSKRSYRDLTNEDHQELSSASQRVGTDDDEWTRAVAAIRELLEYLAGTDRDPGLALGKLLNEQSPQRDKIVHHLEFFLTAGMKDDLWVETRDKALKARLGNKRLDRAWAYFHPEPAKARAARPIENTTTRLDRALAVSCSGLCGVALAYLGWLVLTTAAPIPILSYLLAFGAGYVCVRTGVEWNYRARRLKVKDRSHFGVPWFTDPPEGGFASQVDNYFEYCYRKYGPQKDSRRVAWLAETVMIRRTLRNEVVDLYREERIDAHKVRWLIRHLVIDTRDRWITGTLREYQQRYRTDPFTKLWCVLSTAAVTLALLEAVIAATNAAPLATLATTAVAAVTGRTAVMKWVHITSERRRHAEDLVEYERVLREREEAYWIWKHKLDSRRPSEEEMETWLDCDKKKILDDALRHYRMAWRDVFEYSFLHAPAKYRKRARVEGGPWRYSKYDIRLFLVTFDGVREISTELDFEEAELNGQERNNFRFDAVSSVHVIETNDLRYTLDLTLTNGPVRNIRVTDPEPNQGSSGEQLDALSQINLEAAGFTHTLHILEGIAADGKTWIRQAANTNVDMTNATGDKRRPLTRVPH